MALRLSDRVSRSLPTPSVFSIVTKLEMAALLRLKISAVTE